MKKILSLLLVLAMTASLLAGCGSSAQAPAAVPAETAEAAVTEAAAEATEETQSSLQAPPSWQAPPAVDPSALVPQAAEGEASGAVKNVIQLPTGDLAEPVELSGGQKISQEEAVEIERAMRDYVGHEYDHIPDSYPVNNAFSYFFYDHLDADTRQIYDALYLAALNLYEQEFHVACQVPVNPDSQEFLDMYQVAYYSLCFDHPELFWLYMGDGVFADCKFTGEQDGSYYTVYFFIRGITSVVEQQLIAFNQNVRSYLSLVDTSLPQEELARQIHDLLIFNAVYDVDVMNKGGDDLAHSAYGPIIGNSAGTPFYAVCDGYSLAYLYLLQQVGIEATVVLGNAGSDPQNMGGHAWNLVKLNGQWHEVDVTWDDADPEAFASYPEYPYVLEAMADPWYFDQISHYMYCISTDEISNFVRGNRYERPSDDGQYVFHLVGDSCRERDTVERSFYPYGVMMESVPIAG